ncbi:putative leader peptide [Goodfellowiella coeruleoviolacea]|uniref:Uncharacterized protein n=1 Tax=Goodfellowiella coeruleoviolacea TaxID=334858 RepID=A0AAE3GEG1_9PSEU|nr:putative leader peptide [Goodfellowiella coeruleoviolacea]MCP2166645.1 hypothetical protein [Goodfellowiella coeruleoviolacea]
MAIPTDRALCPGARGALVSRHSRRRHIDLLRVASAACRHR